MIKKDRIWSVIEIVKWTTSYFNKHGLDSPRLKTELLLGSILNLGRLGIYSNFDKPLSKKELNKFKIFIKRAINREPVQMIIGSVQFHDIEINVNSSSIVPRPETEELVSIILNDLRDNQNLEILDIGTGSGCIALSLAKKLPNAQITAVDESAESIKLAANNADKNGLTNIKFEKKDILQENLSGTFDVIVSNPPYIDSEEYEKLQDEVKLFEPKRALTDGGDGCSFYRHFSNIFPEILSKKGKFFLEIGWNQSELIKEIFNKNEYTIEIIKDFNNIPRFVKGKLS